MFYRQFKRSLINLKLTEKAMIEMNTFYPDATDHDIKTIQDMCIICHEDMKNTCKYISIFHIHTQYNCIRYKLLNMILQ